MNEEPNTVRNVAGKRKQMQKDTLSVHVFPPLDNFSVFLCLQIKMLLLISEKKKDGVFFWKQARKFGSARRSEDRKRKTIKRQVGREGAQRREQGKNGDLGNNKANPVPENRMTNDSNYIFSPVIMSFFYAPLFSQGRSNPLVIPAPLSSPWHRHRHIELAKYGKTRCIKCFS